MEDEFSRLVTPQQDVDDGNGHVNGDEGVCGDGGDAVQMTRELGVRVNLLRERRDESRRLPCRGSLWSNKRKLVAYSPELSSKGQGRLLEQVCDVLPGVEFPMLNGCECVSEGVGKGRGLWRFWLLV